jgi:uncharacterized repeat protein (TIGR01451 family)
MVYGRRILPAEALLYGFENPRMMLPIAFNPSRRVRMIAVGAFVVLTSASRVDAQIAFRQVNAAVPQTAQTTVTVPFAAAQTAGNLNVVAIGWSTPTVQVIGVTDTTGNNYTVAAGPTVQAGVQAQVMYIAPNIAGAGPNVNRVSVTFNGAAAFPDVRIAEYSGLATTSPVVGSAGAVGKSTTSNSGALNVPATNALLIGANYVSSRTTKPGTNYTTRVITSPDADILEDRIVTAAGNYSATASLSSGNWVMQIVALRAASVAGDTQPPTAPSQLVATPISSAQINLTWTASTDNVGVTGYRVERCQGAGCTTFVDVGASTTTSYSSTGLTSSTSYTYRVRATDAAGNFSGYSNTSTTSTPAPVDTQPPTNPTSLVSSAISSSRIDLTWAGSTDNVGVTAYRIERCQGAGCANFAETGTSTTTTYSDLALTGSTSYSYRVRATDAAGNLSAYSNPSTAVTPAPADTQPPTDPIGLIASAVSSTQINLSWTGSTDNVGVTAYHLERCSGTGCTTWGEVATPGTAAYSDAGLTAGTSYSYRVRAADAAGNLSGYSNVATTTTTGGVPSPIAFLQVNSAVPQTPQTTVTVPFRGAQTGGNLNVVAIGWGTPNAQVISVSDTTGNVYTVAATPTVQTGVQAHVIFVAANIGPAAANANAVTVTFNAAVDYPDVRIAEYGGLAATNPVEAAAGAVGTGTTANSGTITTTSANVLLVGANYVTATTTDPGAGYTSRVVTSPDGNILEDRIVTAAGSYTATASVSSGSWVMQVVALRGSNAGPPLPDLTVTKTHNASFTQGQVGATYSMTVANSGSTATSGTVSLTDTLPSGLTATALSGPGWGCTTATLTCTRTDALPAGTSYSPVTLTVNVANNAPANVTNTVTVSGGGESNTANNSASDVTTINASSGIQTPTFVQQNYATPQTPQSVVSVTYTQAQTIGNLNVVVIGWSDATSQIQSVTDARGNVYVAAVGPTALAGFATQSIYYAILGHGAAANGNAVTVVFSAAVPFADVRIAEYAGIDPATPVDGVAASSGNGGAGNSGAMTTTGSTDLLVGANYVEAATTAPGSGYTTRVITTPDADILEDRVVGAVGSYSATASLSGGRWIMQLVAFHALGSVAPAPDLTVTKTHAGMFAQGQSGATYTLIVTNVGTAPASGIVTVTDTLPSQLTATALNGAGWNCTLATLTCTRSDALGVGQSYPTMTLTVDVALNAPASITNVATVSGGGQSSGGNDTASDVTVVTGVSVTPATAVITSTQSQQFVVNGLGTQSVVWSVDGSAGGTAATGTITSGGLYAPPIVSGLHTVTATTTDGMRSVDAKVYVTNYSGTFTHHNDNARTGQNLNETVLTPANVRAGSFGKLLTYSLDGMAISSPLYVANVNVPGQGLHNVVYVATEHDSVFAFDADGLSSSPLWSKSFVNPAAGVTSVPCHDPDPDCDISPEIGITSTGVIDPLTRTLYLVAKTKEVVDQNVSYIQRLHALDIASGDEKFGGPVILQASVPGNGWGSNAGVLSLDSLHQNQRPALLLANGVVYIGFGSHSDVQPYHGWLLGYNASTLQQVMAVSFSPDDAGAGLWQANGGPATDSSGNIYVITGNGNFDVNTGGRDYGDSFLKLNTAGTVIDYFTPSNQGTLNANDFDLGAAGPLLLPDQPGAHPHVLVSAGKNNTIYLVDRDNMGHYNAKNDNQVVQSLVNIFPHGTPQPGNYSAPVYFNGAVYFSPVADNIQAFALTNGLLSSAPTSRSSEFYSYPGGALAISANGSVNGILWAIQRNGSCGPPPTCPSAAPGVLRAYDASDLRTQIYSSDQSGDLDALDYAAKFSVPVVANGKVFVSSMSKLTVYGLLP